MGAQLHRSENALTLHLLFQHLEGLVDIVVTNENLHAAYLLDEAGIGRAARLPAGGYTQFEWILHGYLARPGAKHNRGREISVKGVLTARKRGCAIVMPCRGSRSAGRVYAGVIDGLIAGDSSLSITLNSELWTSSLPL